MIWTGLVLAVALQSESSQASSTPLIATACPKPGVPDWRRLPMDVSDYLRAYPPAALKGALSGRAVVSCGVSSKGEPVDCQVVSEEPQGLGFGDAALKLARFYRFRQPCPGESGQVSLPIAFAPPR